MSCMNDTSLYATILGVRAPWKVTSVTPALDEGEIVVRVEAPRSMKLACPSCQAKCSRHDHRTRRWRHLPTCQYRTILEVEVPRVRCAEHGVHQVPVPWAEENSSFTALFESLVISWLKEASISAVASLMDLTWDQVDGIMQRAVRRGLERREAPSPTHIGIDETSFQKRHEYVTVVTDHVSGDVIHVADDRKKESLESFFEDLEPADLLRIESVSMDMWGPFIAVVEEVVHKAEEKICFDKFHVAQHLGDAVNKVRRQEQREQLKEGDRSLVGTKYTWLRNPEKLPRDSMDFFERMKRIAVRTARAWAIKEQGMSLWHYASRAWARKAWKAWIAWAIRSRLEPIKKVARMISKHLEGIINAIVLGVTNAKSESINSKIQRVKRMACGFRNRERFRTAIYFHLGGLDLSPATHTRS